MPSLLSFLEKDESGGSTKLGATPWLLLEYRLLAVDL